MHHTSTVLGIRVSGDSGMPRDRVLITITYGSIEEAFILETLYHVEEELRKIGIEPIVLQVYIPGSRLRISVNGIELEISPDLVENILSTAIETLSMNNYIENKWFIHGKIAAAKAIH